MHPFVCLVDHLSGLGVRLVATRRRGGKHLATEDHLLPGQSNAFGTGTVQMPIHGSTADLQFRLDRFRRSANANANDCRRICLFLTPLFRVHSSMSYSHEDKLRKRKCSLSLCLIVGDPNARDRRRQYSTDIRDGVVVCSTVMIDWWNAAARIFGENVHSTSAMWISMRHADTRSSLVAQQRDAQLNEGSYCETRNGLALDYCSTPVA